MVSTDCNDRSAYLENCSSSEAKDSCSRVASKDLSSAKVDLIFRMA